ncbi:MAG TPA: DUF892 family protein [Micromonosporaceae bacterium]
MALHSPRDLFLFELGTVRDIERSGGVLLGQLAQRVHDDALRQVLDAQAQEDRKLTQNILDCLASIGRSPLETTAHVVEAVRNSFQEFCRMDPSPEVVDLMVTKVSSWYTEHAIVRYRGLLDSATFLGDQECARLLLANLVSKEAFLAKLRQISVASAMQRASAALATSPP